MTVESATFISNLNSALPAATDAKAEGDDHIRLVKAILQAQFPNFTATAVTATCSQLNSAATGSFTTVTASAGATVTGSALLGYGTGAGGSVTQATSKSTGVTLNKPCGQITMHNASLAAGATVAFTLANSLVNPIDLVLANATGAPATNQNYSVRAYPYAGNVVFYVTNVSAGALSDPLPINFAVIKGATS